MLRVCSMSNPFKKHFKSFTKTIKRSSHTYARKKTFKVNGYTELTCSLDRPITIHRGLIGRLIGQVIAMPNLITFIASVMFAETKVYTQNITWTTCLRAPSLCSEFKPDLNHPAPPVPKYVVTWQYPQNSNYAKLRGGFSMRFYYMFRYRNTFLAEKHWHGKHINYDNRGHIRAEYGNDILGDISNTANIFDLGYYIIFCSITLVAVSQGANGFDIVNKWRVSDS